MHRNFATLLLILPIRSANHAINFHDSAVTRRTPPWPPEDGTHGAPTRTLQKQCGDTCLLSFFLWIPAAHTHCYRVSSMDSTFSLLFDWTPKPDTFFRRRFFFQTFPSGSENHSFLRGALLSRLWASFFLCLTHTTSNFALSDLRPSSPSHRNKI